MIKKYRIGFDIWGIVLFLVIMLPNFIWFVLPAPNDILRSESVTPIVDIAASISQIIMIIVLCILVNKEQKRIRINGWIRIVLLCILLYFICWIVYYFGITNTFVILGLTIMPCFAFLFYAIDRKNMIAVIPIIFFMGCHLIYAVINYVI